MATITDPPSETFRLSQLVYDTRYRSLTIQVVAFFLIIGGLAWLYQNTVQNLADLGRTFDIGFLWERSGYDISQRLVEYSNDSTHARAALVGILNTLLVAVLGCITATVIGVIAGVLRLSNNWIVARLMAVYVEAFRNIPLLLWILLIFAIFSEGLPRPRDFIPDAGTGVASASKLFEAVAFTNQGTFIPRPVFAEGAWLFWVALAVAIGAIWALRRFARKRQEATGQIIPTALPSLAIFVGAILAAYLLISAQSRDNELAFIALGAEDGQSLAEYSEAAGRLDFCRIRGSGGSFSAQTHLESADIPHRAVEYFGTRDAAADFVRGRCVLYAVDAEDAPALAATLAEDIRGEETVAILSTTVAEGPAIQADLPTITGIRLTPITGGMVVRNALIALWFALSLYTGAFIAEIVRAGIMSVSRGQSEAAASLGLRPGRIMSLVV
ncbi:MAG: ABC transporter permease subunit, partial [Pseudomonadota bacterium]